MKTKPSNPPLSWIRANQQYLAARFALLKACLSKEKPEERRAALEEAREALPAESALDGLLRIFQLSPFESDLLLLCAGVEMDSQLAALCAKAQGRKEQVHPTFGLALSALEEPHWSALSPSRPLRRWRLVEPDPGPNLTDSPLRIDERVLHLLAGINFPDARLQPILRQREEGTGAAESHQALAREVAQAMLGDSPALPAIQLVGDDNAGQEDVASLAATGRGLQLHILEAEDLPATAQDQEYLATLWERESALLPSALLIQCGGGDTANAARFADKLSGPLFIASRDSFPLRRAAFRFAVRKPGASEQKKLWEKALGPAASSLNGTLDTLAYQFRLSAGAILAAGAQVAPRMGAEGGAERLWDACRLLGRPRLEDLAQRIEPAADWDDLVLPPSQKDSLKRIASQVRNRLMVYDKWGFASRGSRGLGLSALFAGESGTGKTMAAEVLAAHLRLDLYRIDLSAVVSKYIGETEKNLRRIFDAAEEGGAILLFDEADALFGKRGEVKDSHDRYANIEVGYLLQRMEAYRGLAILTTNLKGVLDKAFLRRLRFVVQFPFPDQDQRETLWRQAFPADTPTLGLDPRKLSQLNMAGGHIRNISLNAAFLAAEEKSPVAMAHLFRAAQGEALKVDRPLSDSETRGWL